MTLNFRDHVTSSVTWPFDSRWSTSYGWSIATMHLSGTVIEIWRLKVHVHTWNDGQNDQCLNLLQCSLRSPGRDNYQMGQNVAAFLQAADPCDKVRTQIFVHKVIKQQQLWTFLPLQFPPLTGFPQYPSTHCSQLIPKTQHVNNKMLAMTSIIKWCKNMPFLCNVGILAIKILALNPSLAITKANGRPKLHTRVTDKQGQKELLQHLFQ